MRTRKTRTKVTAAAPPLRRLLLSSLAFVIVVMAVRTVAAPRPGPVGDATKQAIAQDEGSPYDRAVDLYRRGLFEEARDVLEAEIANAPETSAAHLALLGWCRYRMSQADLALSSFRAALAKSPDDADALEGVARSAARLDRVGEALEAVRTLARVRPDADIADVADRLLAAPQAGSDSRLGRHRPKDAAGDAAPGMVARCASDRFEVRQGDGPWRKIFIKGVNVGVALPGRHPSEYPRDATLYAQWLRQIADMGVNLVRVYTLLPPEFYRALAAHNAAVEPGGPGFLWLAQGVWTELPDDHDYEASAFKEGFLEEISRVIDAVHGNLAAVRRPGHAFGLYAIDVSSMTLAFILGREWEPFSVEAYDAGRRRPTSFRGRYLTLAHGTPTEAWLASVMEHAVSHEMATYGMQRPVSFASWPTLDPLRHPTEATRSEEIALLRELELPQEPGTLIEYDNDGPSIDATRIKPTSLAPAGTFATYHAYPYYPDFMNVDPGYLGASGARGPSSYAGYLRDLKAHHAGMPLLIGEVGVPTSLGIAHHQPQGWHHGGHTEREQGEIDARLMEDIHHAGCAGGILFSWMDEWFKRNWLVIDFEVPAENNKNWLNVLDPEQNYGLLAVKPGENGWAITIDGGGSDWSDVDPLAVSPTGPLKAFRVTHDEAYLYLRLDVDRLDYDRAHYLIGIDTYGAGLGDRRMPMELGLTTPTGMEFVVELAGPSSSRVLCDAPYDRHTNRFARPWRSKPNDDGVFVEMLAETARRRVGRDGTIFPAVTYSRSPLRYGTMDPSSPRYDDLVEWSDNPEEGTLELRLGWNILNVTDPSTRQVLDDGDPPFRGTGHSTTDGFRFYVAAYHPAGPRVLGTLPPAGPDGRFAAEGIPFYSWPSWDQPSYHTYLKRSYYILKERLAALGGAS